MLKFLGVNKRRQTHYNVCDEIKASKRDNTVLSCDFRVCADLGDDIRDHETRVSDDERDAPCPWEEVTVQRDEDERCEEQDEQSCARNHERCGEVQGVGVVGLASDVCSRDADTEEDVEHRPAEASGETHDGCEDLARLDE